MTVTIQDLTGAMGSGTASIIIGLTLICPDARLTATTDVSRRGWRDLVVIATARVAFALVGLASFTIACSGSSGGLNDGRRHWRRRGDHVNDRLRHPAPDGGMHTGGDSGPTTATTRAPRATAAAVATT